MRFKFEEYNGGVLRSDSDISDGNAVCVSLNLFGITNINCGSSKRHHSEKIGSLYKIANGIGMNNIVCANKSGVRSITWFNWCFRRRWCTQYA